MKIYHDLEHIGNIKNPVVTTGSFDGVHIGHKTILNRLNEIAGNIDGESVLITFHPHPRKVLFPDTAGKTLLLINSQQEKIELLRKTGLDNLIILNFTKEFSEISSIDFIRNILVGKLHAKKVVIGFNHHFGHNREGNFDYLYELGKYYNFGVEEIPEQDIHNETVSSTTIRKALLEGRIQRANAYLDHHYIIISELFEGSDTCKDLDFPTYRIKIEEENKLVPCDGVYAVNVLIDGEFYKGILNIKNSLPLELRKTDEILIDIHFFNDETPKAGQTAIVFFAKRIRDELHFANQEEMRNQLKSDLSEVEELIY
ncbi:MAG: riboflavin biosynthesis protein RibF [Lentimicrobiaceae bacterium]|nr:riboflavin biosynthesis protein RibF [Lentimicrobiaceae bacterium]MCB9024139.1 riboflavin biosynthesis protein RibF [Lentimicrobiaceae bacterium]MCO5264923.1 riboflavin biosynthesis protein RibF [Lentimicrobium sp.]